MKNFICTCIIFGVYFLIFTNMYSFREGIQATAICTIITYLLVLKDYKFLDKLIENKNKK